MQNNRFGKFMTVRLLYFIRLIAVAGVANS